MEFVATQIKNLKIPLHSIEIVGGATRMPIIQQIIMRALNLDQISKTLNASECIARGISIIKVV